MHKKIVSKCIVIFIMLYSFNIFAQEEDLPPPYSLLWAEVKDLEVTFPKKALELVDSILISAKREKNKPQIVKALLKEIELRSQYEENALQTAITRLEAEIEINPFPVNAILQSILAEIYWQYYQVNRHKILNRTTTLTFTKSDIDTWDAQKFHEKILELVTQSLSESARLQKISIRRYRIFLVKGKDTLRFRPTLYDFLANRAVGFFSNEELRLTQPVDHFRLTDPKAFAPTAEFVKLTFPTSDTLSYKRKALKVYQDIIRFHLANSKPDALVDAELNRLRYVHNISKIAGKDSLYLKALHHLAAAYSSHTVSALVQFEIAHFYYKRSTSYNRLQPETGVNLTYKNDLKRAEKICKSTVRNFKKHPDSKNCQELLSLIKQKKLKLSVETINEPQRPFRGAVTFQNVNKIHVKIISVDPELRESENWNTKYNNKEKIKFLKSQPSIAEFTVDLPDDGDHHEHITEIKFPELPHGYYGILIGSTLDFSGCDAAVDFGFIWLSNISYVTRRHSGSDGISVYVMDRSSGKPLEGAVVSLWKYDYDSGSNRTLIKTGDRYVTDRNGYIWLPPRSSRSLNKRVFLDIAKHDDRLFLMKEVYITTKTDPDTRQDYWRAALFTDRAIYRPGQTVYFKGLLLKVSKNKNEIVTNHPVKVVFQDVNQKELSSLLLTTNDYGTFHGSFIIPHNILTGQMTIKTQYGDIQIQVEEYKRPSFEVKFQPIQGSFKLGEVVSVTGTAKAYTGMPIGNAIVKFKVVRKVSFRYFWERWFFPIPNEEEYVVNTGTIETDADGQFSIEFLAEGEENLGHNFPTIYNFHVSAEVVDITGETRAVETLIRIGTIAVQVAFEIPENIDLEKPLLTTISSRNLNGEFEPIVGELVVYKLNSPNRVLRERLWAQPDRFTMDRETYVKLFPHDPYAGEDDYRNWEKQEVLYRRSFDTAQTDTVRFESAKEWPQGKYLFELTTKDTYGTEIKLQQYATGYTLSDRRIPDQAISWFHPSQNSVKPGEIAQLFWGSAASDIFAIVEINRQDDKAAIEYQKSDDKKNVILLPVHQSDIGGIHISILYVKFGRAHWFTHNFVVPDINKTLNISYETFRDKLKPGTQEEWRFKITNADGEAVAAEFLAAMYDASLDAFIPHHWSFFPPLKRQMPQHSRYDYKSLRDVETLTAVTKDWHQYIHFWQPAYDELKLSLFGYYRGHMLLKYGRSGAKETYYEDNHIMYSPSINEAHAYAKTSVVDSDEPESPAPLPTIPASFDEIPIRKNLSETAFFYPVLRTDENGAVIVSFTMPEALTRWKFLGFAHTRQIYYGLTEKEVVTRKELMVTPNAPRFFREGDHLVFTGKVSNMSNSTLQGQVTLQLFDAETMQPLPELFADSNTVHTFTLSEHQSSAYGWKLQIPHGLKAVIYRLIAKTDQFSDGEENIVPVISNRMLVTESLPLSIRGNTQRKFTFENLVKSAASPTLQHERMVLEFSTNPVWYAVTALPYLMEYPYDCSEQIASRFYANSLSTYIVGKTPRIQQTIAMWKNITPEAFYSNLEKNAELKSIILEETPWILEAADERESRRRIALLLDINRLANESRQTFLQLKELQTAEGAWPWFKGMHKNRYITTHILTMLGQLRNVNAIPVNLRSDVEHMSKKTVFYLLNYLSDEHDKLLIDKVDLTQQHITREIVHILYALSYFKDIFPEESSKPYYVFWITQAAKHWHNAGRYSQGMLALLLHRNGNTTGAQIILKSLKEHALTSDEFGVYWRNEWGYYWYEAPIELQALMIEAFKEISDDADFVKEMRIWLLKQKQTTHWETTKATAAACYALLMGNPDLSENDDTVVINLGNVEVSSKNLTSEQETGTGYFKKVWQRTEINPQMGQITVKKVGSGIAWGAVYWQYFESLDVIPQHQTGLHINKALFLQKNTPEGTVLVPLSENITLKTGDLVTVRIELRTDRDLEYVHMKDMRAAGLEPVNVLSHTKYQSGLLYYESTRDVATHFFFDYINKGTYVFEYSLRVFHAGDFSNGITTVQCMYAPEFSAHSQGSRIQTKQYTIQ
jgi:hypothetical protein